jgi:SAM-dependent methyltransferase
MTEEQFKGYGIGEGDDIVELETRRLGILARWRDPATIRALTDVGIGPGWRCLEIGAGSGSVAHWMAEQVAPSGSVLSVDIDLRFHCEASPNMEIRQVDVLADPLPEAEFDLVHARAVLTHLLDRPKAVDRFVSAAKPGGWVVIEEADWRAFEAQPLPWPLAGVAAVVNGGLRNRTGSNPDIGTDVLRMLAERGLTDLDVSGEVRPMWGGTESMHWWSLGLQHAGPRLVESGAVTQDDLDEAIAITEDPNFVMLSSLTMSVRGRVPLEAPVPAGRPQLKAV